MNSLMIPHGILFHHFHGGPHPRGQGSLSAAGFAALLDAFDPAIILPAEEWMARARDGRLRPSDLCLTFDDGLACQRDIALPVMQERGLTAFWFVYTGPLRGGVDRLELYRHFRTVCFTDIGSFYEAFDEALATEGLSDAVSRAIKGQDLAAYLPEKQFYSLRDRRFRFIRDRVLGEHGYNRIMDRMISTAGFRTAEATTALWIDPPGLRALAADGHVIGSHSHSHPTQLSALPVSRQEEEFATSCDILGDTIGQPVTTMAHPCGDYSADTLRILSRLGIDIGFRADMTRGPGTLLELPRENHAHLLARISGVPE